MPEYDAELAELGPLAPTAIALIDYAKALVPGVWWLVGRRSV